MPLAAKQFTDSLKDDLRRELTALNAALPSLDWLEITDRKAGAIKLTPLEPLREPRNLRKLKRACVARWGNRPADRDAQGKRRCVPARCAR